MQPTTFLRAFVSYRCHAAGIYSSVVCLEACPKSKSGCDHLCLRYCGEEYEKSCNVRVTNVQLKCRHVRQP